MVICQVGGCPFNTRDGMCSKEILAIGGNAICLWFEKACNGAVDINNPCGKKKNIIIKETGFKYVKDTECGDGEDRSDSNVTSGDSGVSAESMDGVSAENEQMSDEDKGSTSDSGDSELDGESREEADVVVTDDEQLKEEKNA